MPELSDFQEISLQGMEFDTVTWRGEILRAEFGAGYGAKAVVGDPGGLHRWAISSECLPGDVDYGNLIEGKPRFDYYFDFIRDHITGDRDVFQIDYRGKKYHASFAEPEFGAEVLTYDLFNGGIEIRQRRVKGITYDTDGSILIVANLPGLWSWHSAESGWNNSDKVWSDKSINANDMGGPDPTDVIRVDDVQNGRQVLRFNSTTPAGYLTPFGSPEICEAVIVMKMREASFSNFGGVMTADDTVAVLTGDTGETEFLNIGIGAAYQYRFNGVDYPESGQVAPMNQFGIVHVRFNPGVTIENIQFGRDRDFGTGRFALMDIGEIIIATESWTDEVVDLVTRYASIRWGITI